MDKKAKGEIEEFIESVWPDGYTPPAAAAKRPAASTSGTAKKPKIDPDNIDAKSLAQANKVCCDFLYFNIFCLLQNNDVD